MRALRAALKPSGRPGFTLIELMIAVVIVGILAAVAIPVFVGYRRDAGLSEARANLQGILEAEQAYFSRFQRYTPALGWCPPGPVPTRDKVLWPKDTDIEADCGAGWKMLGWSPDDAVAFRYRVFSAYGPTGSYDFAPRTGPITGVAGGADTFGVAWGTEFLAGDPQPWCTVEAEADSDDDHASVYMRSNSYNFKMYRWPNPDVDGITTW